jgi:two-component system, probable response regulator PhcQ
MDHPAIPHTLPALIKAGVADCLLAQFTQRPASSVNNQPKTIVMVDDEKAYADFLETMLTETFGCPVRKFTRPTDALAQLATINAGIIITDYYMPQMTGFDFIQRASRVAPGVPFILVTGNSIHCEDHDVGPDLPLRAILAKPFSWRKLADEIVRHAPEFARKPSKPAVETDPNVSASNS